MSKKTIIIIMNVALIVVWVLVGLQALMSEHITKLSYGCCWFILIVTFVMKTVAEIRNEELLDLNRRLLKILTDLTNLKKRGNDQ